MNDSVSLWPLRLLATAIAVVSWLLASYLPRVEELSTPLRTKSMIAPVTYDSPAGFLILNPESTVEVLVRGNREVIRDLTPFQVDVDVPLPDRDLRAGTLEVLLGVENVSLPEGVEVLSISPDRLLLRIDRVETRRLPVRVEFTGEPAAGARPDRDRTVVTPTHLDVRGPLTRLNNINEVVAEVSIEGRALSDDYQVAVRAPDPLLQIVPPGIVTVRVVMRSPGLPVDTSGGNGRSG